MTFNNEGLLSGSSMDHGSAGYKETDEARGLSQSFPPLPATDRLGSHPTSVTPALLTPHMIQSAPSNGYAGYSAADERYAMFNIQPKYFYA